MRQAFRRLLAAVGMFVLAAALAAHARADTTHKVTIVNATHHKIVEFHARYLNGGMWDDDLLGSDVLEPSASVVFEFDTHLQCIRTLTGIFDDGSKVERDRVNVCKISIFRFTED